MVSTQWQQGWAGRKSGRQVGAAGALLSVGPFWRVLGVGASPGCLLSLGNNITLTVSSLGPLMQGVIYFLFALLPDCESDT